MQWLTTIRAFLNGKKTILGSLALALLSATYFADQLADGKATWLSEEQYIAIGGLITGLTGVAMRLGMKKPTDPPTP